MSKFTKIISSGSYLPEKILTNKELEGIVDTTDEWITERTGIKERRVSSEDETSVDTVSYTHLTLPTMMSV